MSALRDSFRIFSEYSKEAFDLGPHFREVYAEKMWNLARHVLLLDKRDYKLFAECLIKSQFYKPSLKRVFSSLQTKLKQEK